jgi:hypothetical protein
MKFSPANNKIVSLYTVPDLRKYFKRNRKIYSFDMLSGHSCPFAQKCLSKVVETDGKRKLVDGPEADHRCFSASTEIAFPVVHDSRSGNFQGLRTKNKSEMSELINSNIPENLGVCRLHVGGDFFNQEYFDAWIDVANKNSDRLFYAYTKSLPYWVKRLDSIPKNLILTASYGGRCDHMIPEHNLRNAIVVFHPSETKLPIDHSDEWAANPKRKHRNFALLLHGIQKAGSTASEAIKRLKSEGVKFSYGRS